MGQMVWRASLNELVGVLCQIPSIYMLILLDLGYTYLKDDISQGIRMQNKQMIICEEISAPPVYPTDIFATRMDTSTSS